MEIYADIRQKVHVNPQDVIEKLIEKEVGFRGWVFEKDGKYYRGWESGGGTHSWEESSEIDKKVYDYVMALGVVLRNLEEKNKK